MTCSGTYGDGNPSALLIRLYRLPPVEDSAEITGRDRQLVCNKDTRITVPMSCLRLNRSYPALLADFVRLPRHYLAHYSQRTA